jgi:RNA polymerase sigma factor (sigma-70 family)
MADGLLRPVLDQLRRQAGAAAASACTDRQLLDRFVAVRDESAFQALVGRHGPMVLGVCRRLLPEPDAADAFQATFLVLVRKAGSLSDAGRVGAWLHGVACRTAREARRLRAWRARRERLVDRLPERPAPVDEAPDWVPLLDEEIGRLPEKYRVVVVLCELEGRSRSEAAQQLGVPEGTLSSRLARARALLRRRLARRGLPFAFGLALAEVPPPALAAATAQAALAFAAPGQVHVTPTAAALAEKVIHAMTASRLKIAAALVLAALCLTGGATFARHAWSVAPAEAAAPPPPAAKKPVPRVSLAARIDPPAEVAATAPELRAALVLTNDGNVPVRVCTLVSRSNGPGGRFDYRLRPDWWKMEAPTLADSAKHVVTLAPGRSVSLPLSAPRSAYRDRASCTLTATYAVEDRAFADRLEIWSGRVAAPPREVKVRRSAEQPAIDALEKLGLSITSIGFDENDPARPVVDVNLDEHVGDDDLVLLRQFHRLQALRMGRRITGAGLKHLRGMTQLRELYLNHAGTITDDGLAHLEGLTGLRVLDLGYTAVTDAGLRRLRGLTRLRELRLYHTGITDAGLASLSGMKDLAFLDIGDTKVTDAGLPRLKGLAGLETLYLSETAVTDAGLAFLRNFPRLRVLSVQSTRATDAGLAHLRALDRLDTLYLAHTNVTDAGMEQLGSLRGLRELDLAGTRITDRGLARLGGLGKLQSLNLNGTKVDDSGLLHLRPLRQLRSLSLLGTGTTDRGIADLRKALPGLAVRRHPLNLSGPR